MKNKKIVSLILIILAIILVLSLWRLPIFLIIGLLILAFLKHKFSPIKKELTMFIVSAFVGSIGESLVMIGGPWSYASNQILNFPIWLPFLWGLAGIIGITIYQSITDKK